MYIHEDVCITMICISYVVMLVGRDTKLFEGLGVLADDNLLVVATYHTYNNYSIDIICNIYRYLTISHTIVYSR